jgi:hypothetical protein
MRRRISRDMTIVKVAVKTCDRCDKSTSLFAFLRYPSRHPKDSETVKEYEACLCPECFEVYQKLERSGILVTGEDYAKEFFK